MNGVDPGVANHQDFILIDRHQAILAGVNTGNATEAGVVVVAVNIGALKAYLRGDLFNPGAIANAVGVEVVDGPVA